MLYEQLVRHGVRCGIRSARKNGPRAERGFTLIELMIVISIILILIGMAVGMYQRSLIHARETVLRKDLQTMREAIAITRWTNNKLRSRCRI